jgi:DNA-binding NarL/FixJ family response regulator
MHPINTYIVEDSPLIRENLAATLEELTPVRIVGMAQDEATALEWLSRPECDVALVIVDIFLKGGSGLGLLRSAREQGVKARMVVLSNYATPDVRTRCESLGADRVFDKSSEIDALIAFCATLGSEAAAALP